MMQNSASPVISRQPRTLLVEPDTEIQQMLELALSIRGHIVTVCETAAEARECVRGARYGIIIIDTFLSDTGGVELARQIRADHSGRPVIVLLASDGEQSTIPGMDSSIADDILPWPADMDQLRHRFDRIEQLAADRIAAVMPESTQPRDEPFLVLSSSGAIQSASPVAESLFGFPPASMPGANGFSFFHPDDAAILLSIVTESVVTPGRTRAVEVRVRREGDTWRTIAISATNKIDDPSADGIAFSLEGPNTQVNHADQITRGTLHDPATGLPNATLFHDRIDHAIARGARHDHPVIVMMLDFNGFQDETGQPQEVDDGLFIALSQRIRSCLRMSDTAERLGYDEFGIILEEIVDTGNVQIVADRLIRTLDIPFYDDGREKQITPNIGIVISSLERFRAGELLRDANIARTWARVQGSGRYVVFDPSMAAPDDEPITSQFNIADVMAVVAGSSFAESSSVDDRLARLQQRVNALEKDLERMERQGSFSR